MTPRLWPRTGTAAAAPGLVIDGTEVDVGGVGVAAAGEAGFVLGPLDPVMLLPAAQPAASRQRAMIGAAV